MTQLRLGRPKEIVTPEIIDKIYDIRRSPVIIVQKRPRQFTYNCGRNLYVLYFASKCVFDFFFAKVDRKRYISRNVPFVTLDASLFIVSTLILLVQVHILTCNPRTTINCNKNAPI